MFFTVKFKYILCFGSTTYLGKQLQLAREFKYILCFGSTSFMEIFVAAFLNLNTSYVSVQRDAFMPKENIKSNLNTSYVSVQL